ncbi:hypothetical protein BaRGS_00014891 [Batillaria attramentaria]|uniref:NEDD4-binding protein 1 n=1 Tax=Batillaria attramentaria TaxID=370345 RepID=A0ABD0L3R1_9CAEN
MRDFPCLQPASTKLPPSVARGMRQELAVDGSATGADSSVDDEDLFASGPEPVPGVVERNPHKNAETELAAVCKQAVMNGHSQEDIESALGFIDYSDRVITYDELEEIVMAVKAERTREKVCRRNQAPDRQGSPDDKSVIIIDESDTSVLNDSVIFMGNQTSNDSVCLVDSFPMKTPPNSRSRSDGPVNTQNANVWTEHRGPSERLQDRPGWPNPSRQQPPVVTQKKATPSKAGSYSAVRPASSAPSTGRQQTTVTASMPSSSSGKRKVYSDDEEETCVLKPCRESERPELGARGSSGGFSGSSFNGPTVPREFGAPPSAQPELFHIIVDGSNVAMCHGDMTGRSGKVFSCRGIEICANYFLRRGHQVTVFVPLWRKYRTQHPDNPIRDQDILDRLEEQGIVKFTPARKLPNGKFVASHEDKWVLDLAVNIDGVVVSNDHFREFAQQGPGYSHILTNRLLQFQFVNDIFMPTPDPLGKFGPLLNEFLQKGWGMRHAERSQPQLTQQPAIDLPYRPQPQPHRHPATQPQFRQQVPLRPPRPLRPPVLPVRPMQQPARQRPQRPSGQSVKVFQDGSSQQKEGSSQVPKRHPDVTADLLKTLKEMFPEEDQEHKIRSVLENHASETDLNRLTNYCFSALFL